MERPLIFDADPLKLPAGSYFLTRNGDRDPVAFLRDDEGRFIRLHDGVYADGFFAHWNSDRISPVHACTREEALEAVRVTRSRYAPLRKRG